MHCENHQRGLNCRNFASTSALSCYCQRMQSMFPNPWGDHLTESLCLGTLCECFACCWPAMWLAGTFTMACALSMLCLKIYLIVSEGSCVTKWQYSATSKLKKKTNKQKTSALLFLFYFCSIPQTLPALLWLSLRLKPYNTLNGELHVYNTAPAVKQTIFAPHRAGIHEKFSSEHPQGGPCNQVCTDLTKTPGPHHAWVITVWQQDFISQGKMREGRRTGRLCSRCSQS